MKSFIIGKIVEPYCYDSQNGKVLTFGVLSGRNCQEFSVFEFNVHFQTGERTINPYFAKVSSLAENDTVAVVVNCVVTKKNTLGIYLSDIAKITDSFRSDFKQFFLPVKSK